VTSGGNVGSDPKMICSVLSEIEQQVTARPSCSVKEALVQSVDILGVLLSDEVGKLILVTYVLEYDLILFIEQCLC